MTPKILSFNQNDYTHALSRATIELQKVQQFVNNAIAIAPIDFTKSLLIDSIGHEPGRVVNAIRQAVNDQLTAAKITIPAIKDNAIKESVEAFYKLKATVHLDSEIIHHLFIENNIVRFIDTYDNELRERFTHKIRTEEGLEIYEAHLLLFEAIENLNSKLHSNFQGKVDQLYRWDLDSRSYKISSVNYDTISKNYKH